MRAINKATGAAISGTLERLTGQANIQREGWRRADDGTLDFDYEGYTEITWDDQKTAIRDGQRVFLDANGDEVLERDIELIEDEGSEDHAEV